MTAGFYRPGNGFLARAHPATRILAMIGAFVPQFFSDDPVFQLACLLIALLPAMTTGALSNLWRLKALALAIFFVSLILWSLTLPGARVWVTVGPLTVFGDAASVALGRAVRLLTFLVIGVTFLTVTSVEDFTHGLRCLGLPYRAGFAVTLAFRLAPLFLESAEQIANAQRTRGLELDHGPFWSRWRRFVPLMVPMVIAGFRRADGLAVALEAKGFSAPGRRTHLQAYRVTWRDALLLCTIVCLNIGARFFTK